MKLYASFFFADIEELPRLPASRYLLTSQPKFAQQLSSIQRGQPRWVGETLGLTGNLYDYAKICIIYFHHIRLKLFAKFGCCSCKIFCIIWYYFALIALKMKCSGKIVYVFWNPTFSRCIARRTKANYRDGVLSLQRSPRSNHIQVLSQY